MSQERAVHPSVDSCYSTVVLDFLSEPQKHKHTSVCASFRCGEPSAARADKDADLNLDLPAQGSRVETGARGPRTCAASNAARRAVCGLALADM